MINTKRLTFHMLSAVYYKELFDIWKDETVVKYTRVKKMKTEFEARERILSILYDKMDWDYPNHFVIEYQGKIIGTAGFPIINYDGFRCRLYYQLNRAYWNQGFGTELVSGLVEYIYKEYNQAVVYTSVVTENTASRKILEHNGFLLAYIQKDEFMLNDTRLDVAHYELNYKTR